MLDRCPDLIHVLLGQEVSRLPRRVFGTFSHFVCNALAKQILSNHRLNVRNLLKYLGIFQQGLPYSGGNSRTHRGNKQVVHGRTQIVCGRFGQGKG